MADLGERVAVVEEAVRALTRTVEELDREINGPGNGGRKSIRQRLHRIDNEDNAIVRAADARRRRLTGWERAGLFVLAAWATVGQTVGLYFASRGGR